jgi:branched-chain amino acid transport system substrate-binding protein
MKSTWSLVIAAAAWALASGAAHAQISDDVVKIGVLNDQSGPYSDLAGMGSVVAAQLAIDDFGGKVGGKPIQLVSADHQNKPDIGANIANRWIDVDKVDAIIDVPTSSVALAIQEITKTKDRVHINSGAGSSDLTGKACSPTAVHWTYDTYALAHGTGTAMTKQGGDSWFFITADYAFGHALETDTAAAVKDAGGKVLGAVNAPFPNTDFSSFLLQAQASTAKVIGLANAGTDTTNAIKQAHEFGLTQGGQKLAGLLTFITDVNSLGLETAQGLVLTDAWYWDRDEETRAWSSRWAQKMGTPNRKPTSVQAGVYSAITQYLKAIQLSGTDEARKVVDTMKATPINDMFTKNGHIRPDGRMVHDMYLMQVKTPAESKYPWDYFKVLRVIPGDEAFRPMDKGNCPLVQAAVK